MHILITGGSGFLGARLARTLLARGSVSRGGAAAQVITRITLADRAPPPPVTGRHHAEASPESPPVQPEFNWNPMRRGASSSPSFGTARRVTDSWLTCWISWVLVPESSRP